MITSTLAPFLTLNVFPLSNGVSTKKSYPVGWLETAAGSVEDDVLLLSIGSATRRLLLHASDMMRGNIFIVTLEVVKKGAKQRFLKIVNYDFMIQKTAVDFRSLL